mmetsp:Transcript_12354/g.32116  ORF Transcript_12354/g.32116 Transcript_12354/m.32116 type:complete len:88 (-) Transcript_12354:6-269(-)
MGMEEATPMADPAPDVLILLPLNAQEMTVTLLRPSMYIPPPSFAELPLIVQVVTVTVLPPPRYIPPPYSAVLPVMLQPWACRVPPFM